MMGSDPHKDPDLRDPSAEPPRRPRKEHQGAEYFGTGSAADHHQRGRRSAFYNGQGKLLELLCGTWTEEQRDRLVAYRPDLAKEMGRS